MRKLLLLLANYSVLLVFIMCVTSCGDKEILVPFDNVSAEFGGTSAIISFVQTGSYFKKNGFNYDGETYDYKYDVRVNVSIIEIDRRMVDWGFGYINPNGKYTYISLKDINSPHIIIDTCFVYYSNEATSTIKLFDYNKQENGTVYYYYQGSKLTYNLIYEVPFLCPNSNHPHMVDLGLPSGTKWSCSNVDTDHPANQSPANFGGYYAWGETETKSTYDWSTYKHCDGSVGSCHDLGSDIAGTKYDVAHVKWGGKWQMPTVDQIKELKDNSTYKQTTENGVKGGKFISKKNGASIFLPAAGHHMDGGLADAGENGYYWSSTQHPNYSYYAFQYNGMTYRGFGQSVRPVVKN